MGECVNFRHAFLDKEPTIGGSRGTRGNRGGRGRGRGQPPEAILQIVTTSPQAAGVLEGEELEDKVEERAVEGA